MIDVVALISAVAPYTLQLITAVFSFVVYLKTGKIHAALQPQQPKE